MTDVQIAPSVLPADFSRLGDEVAALEKAGVDLVQWDVMDGQFVPNLTFGPDVIAACRDRAAVPFEAHLMVLTPDVLAPRYVEAGCQRLIVHAEACTHLHRTLGAINELGATAGVAINPATPAGAVAHVLDLVDLVLVMTVNPGFGGQDYLASMEPKIAEVRRMVDDAGLADRVHVEVDGGIGPETIAGAAGAGADVLVAGSALFRDPEGLAHAVADLRERAAAAWAAKVGRWQGRPVKLLGLELRRVAMPLVRPFRTSFGVETDRDILLVRAETDAGEGWGECVAMGEPRYSPEYVDGAQHVIERFFAPVLLAQPALAAADVARLLAVFEGHPMAKAAVEMAVLDAELRAAGTSFATAPRRGARPGPGGGVGRDHRRHRDPAGPGRGLPRRRVPADQAEDRARPRRRAGAGGARRGSGPTCCCRSTPTPPTPSTTAPTSPPSTSSTCC